MILWETPIRSLFTSECWSLYQNLQSDLLILSLSSSGVISPLFCSRNYFTLMCRNEPMDEFFENTYHRLVPQIYTPEPSVLLARDLVCLCWKSTVHAFLTYLLCFQFPGAVVND